MGSEIKPTRQWDAWTREEEENFFGALRQVGKNFEKITSRVQSKNKDQVRHYYYRVIKRMNRILAPTLILDAKNSTYVNSAMLRWWSLLEKHSCSASKLRLKPRRFKTFVTALEHQLLKDHKKVKPKKSTPIATTSRKHGAHSYTTAAGATGLPDLVTSDSGVSKSSTDDMQSGQSVGTGRKTAVKRKANTGPRKSVPKGEAKRPPRPRKKPTDGNLSKAAYAKWEKAASVGVSLVAEAAEQLERASADELILPASETSQIQIKHFTRDNVVNVDVQTGQLPPVASAAFSELGLMDKKAKELPSGARPVEPHGVNGPAPSVLSDAACSPQTASLSLALLKPSMTLNGALSGTCKGVSGGQALVPELPAQVVEKLLDVKRCNNCSTSRCNGPEEVKNDMAIAKLKLQLFPFDDFIRKALEQDGHNPHLELTLKARKSISSVLHHLVQKWGRSTVASGELRLFPFDTQWANVSACQSWNFQDLNVSAGDVHAALGSPAVFRLRYAWLSTRILESSSAVLQQQHICSSNESGPVLSKRASYPGTQRKNAIQLASVLPNTAISQSSCVRTSTGSSVELSRPSEQIQPLGVSASAPRKEDARLPLQHAVPRHKVLGVDVHVPVPSVESFQRSSVCAIHESEHGPVSKLTGSNEITVVAAELHKDKELVQSVQNLTSFAHGEAENVNRSTCKEHDNASQASGCAWLYESNDGFAQQLWNYEDTPRSNNGVSLAQMDWVDSLTNISLSELLGEASRAVCSAPLDCLQPCSGQNQLNCLDAFDLSIAGQELPPPGPMLMPIVHSSSAAIWGGDDTCDAFSFQKVDQCNKETINSLGEEISANSLGLDATFTDFRSMACWREGESLVTFDIAEQPQHSQSQDLLFDGDTSVGLGGLIEALAQGSLDEFQACAINHDEEGDIDHAIRQGCEISGEARAENGEICTELSNKDGTGVEKFGNFCERGRIDELCNGNSDLIELCGRQPEESLPNVPLPPQDEESLKESRSVNTRLQRKKELRPPQRSFKLPGEYSTVRSLKLQG